LVKSLEKKSKWFMETPHVHIVRVVQYQQ